MPFSPSWVPSNASSRTSIHSSSRSGPVPPILFFAELNYFILWEIDTLTKPIKHVEKAVAVAANAAWFVFDKLNSISPNPSFTPKWSDKPLLKSWEKQKPKLGWPRETDSLCPRVRPGDPPADSRREAAGGDPARIEKVGEIKAKIIERDGKIVMVKECPIHGQFEDVMSIDPAFSQAPGRRVPGPRHPRAQRRKAARPRHQHHHARARIGADDRSDQPLQHDVRSVFHGRQSGRVRA